MSFDDEPKREWTNEEKEQYVWKTIQEAAIKTGSSKGIYPFYQVTGGETEYDPVYLTRAEQRVILRDFEYRGKISISVEKKEDGTDRYVFEILEPKRQRNSFYSHRIKSFADLLKDVELSRQVRDFIVRAFDVYDIREVKTTQEVTTELQEKDDELFLLMDELGLTKTDWDSLKKQTHRPVGSRYVRIRFLGESCKRFADSFTGRTSIIKARTIEHLAGIFKDMRTRQGLEDLFVQEGVPPCMLIPQEGSKADLVHAVLLILASTGEEDDKNLLFKIIEEFVHPLSFGGDEKEAYRRQIEITKLIRYDNLSVIGGKVRNISKEDEEAIKEYDRTSAESSSKFFDAMMNDAFADMFNPKSKQTKQVPKQASPSPEKSDSPVQQPPIINIYNQNSLSNEVSSTSHSVAMSQDGGNDADKTGKGNKFPHPIPAGTTWNNVVITFLDDRRVKMNVSGKEHTANYVELGLTGYGNPPAPSVLWSFLRVLAQLNGEIEIKDPEAKDQYKKQKQQLSQFLKKYFSLDTDPFHPYKNEKSYKTKFTVFCDVSVPASTSDNKQNIEESLDDEIASELARQAPSVIEDIPIAE